VLEDAALAGQRDEFTMLLARIDADLRDARELARRPRRST